LLMHCQSAFRSLLYIVHLLLSLKALVTGQSI
jgi:hypothetical protein